MVKKSFLKNLIDQFYLTKVEDKKNIEIKYEPLMDSGSTDTISCFPEDGISEFAYENGSYYVGSWKQGKRHGFGVMYYYLKPNISDESEFFKKSKKSYKDIQTLIEYNNTWLEIKGKTTDPKEIEEADAAFNTNSKLMIEIENELRINHAILKDSSVLIKRADEIVEFISKNPELLMPMDMQLPFKQIQEEQQNLANLQRLSDEQKLSQKDVLSPENKFYFERYQIALKKIEDIKVNIITPNEVKLFLGSLCRFGLKYEGEWINDKFSGKGTYYWSSGEKYEGNFVDGRIEGKGAYKYSNDDLYQGFFINGVAFGRGTSNWNYGEKHIGMYKDNMLEGKGTYYFTNGDIYKGKFKSGKRHGGGTYIYSDGGHFYGQWRKGERFGPGVEVDKVGNKINVKYKNGELIFPDPLFLSSDSSNNSSLNEKDTTEVQTILAVDKAEEFLKELNSLVGLSNVKLEITKMIKLNKVNKLRKEQGFPVDPSSMHMIFLGNPGTGKTTVARLIGQIFKESELLKKGHVVEVDRSGLIGQYIGHSEKKTQEVIDKARGGILFIDEAYSLVKTESSNDFGVEVIELLMKDMEDYRADYVVIVAGYTDKMNTFLKSNPGLASRFSRTIKFDDYSPTELLEIFMGSIKKYQLKLTPSAEIKVKQKIESIASTKDEDFANARTIRNFFENIKEYQSLRVSELINADIQTIDAEDIPD